MKLLRSITLTLSADADQEELLFDQTHERTEEATAIVAESSSGVMKLAADTEAPIPFGPVTTAKAVLIIVDKNCKLTFNGGAEQIDLVPSTDGTRGVFYCEGAFTEIQVENQDEAAVATVLYALAGV